MIDLVNKKPRDYVEASFCGHDTEGMFVSVVKKTIDEYKIALYSEDGKWVYIGNDNYNIPFEFITNKLETNKNWRICIIYNAEGNERISFLRKNNIEMPNVCNTEFFDKRALFGEAIALNNGKILLPFYQDNGILAFRLLEKHMHIYMTQLKNEIDYEHLSDDSDEEKKYYISAKCKSIQGSYIGIIPIDSKLEENIEDKCTEYICCEEYEDYVSMEFALPYEDYVEKKEYCVVWSYKGQRYMAPLCRKEEKHYARVIKLENGQSGELKLDVIYDSSIYGEYISAKLVDEAEEWEENKDKVIKYVSVRTSNRDTIVSYCINTAGKLQKLGSWHLLLYTVNKDTQYELDVTISDNVMCKEIYDMSDTRYKLTFKKNNEVFTINRVYGHNALFKKNIQSESDISLDEFLKSNDITLKGNMYGEYIEIDGQLKIHLYQQLNDVLEAKVVMYHNQGMGVLSTQDISVIDGVLEEFEVKTPNIDWDNKFTKPVDSIWFRVAIAIKSQEGIYLSMLSHYDIDTDVEQDGNIHDSRKLYLSHLDDSVVCGVNMTAVPYYANNKALAMKYVRPEQLYRSQFTNEILDVRIKKDILTVKMRCRPCAGAYKGVVMEYRKVKEDDVETHFIPYESLKKDKDFYIMTTRIDMKKYYMRMLYWDIRCAFEIDGKLYNVSCHSNNNKLLRKYKKIFVDRTYPNENSIMFPFATGSNSVALMHREVCPQDFWSFRLKEKFAEKLYKLFKNHWDKKNIYLIFEKYCTMAQDNGYFFFKYCMDANVEKDFKGEIYYVIERKSADWDKVVPYKKHVLKYLSIKHMIYLQACKLMISTDTKGHAYVWRSMGSDIKALTYQKNLVFLQHGVTAFKRGHFERGTNVGCESFITTSQFEHDIIHDYLGYPDSEIPITGFARWDVLRDKSEGHREILMMPTWRTWLDDAENEVFAESDYCKNYMALLNDPRLDEILKKYDVTLNFYLHPKFRKFITEFSVVSDNIRLIPFGEEPLNELMMQCNLLITDFSSVAWDVYYMNKPVLFYHFDLDDAYKTLGFYMDMRKDIFGERAEEPEALMQLIIEYIENGFEMKEKFAKDREKYFAYVDDNNSERIWKSIQERQW